MDYQAIAQQQEQVKSREFMASLLQKLDELTNQVKSLEVKVDALKKPSKE
jgi:hypothetical protein